MNEKSLENLTPFKEGNQLARKPDSEHRNKTISIRVTQDELKKVSKDSKDSSLSISKYCRKKLGLNP